MATKPTRHTPQQKKPSVRCLWGPNMSRGPRGGRRDGVRNQFLGDEVPFSEKRMQVVAQWVMEVIDLTLVSCTAKETLPAPRKTGEGVGPFCSSLPNGEKHHGNKTKWPHATTKKTLSKIPVKTEYFAEASVGGAGWHQEAKEKNWRGEKGGWGERKGGGRKKQK